MKLVKKTPDYSHYDLETTPQTMVIVTRDGIITLEQNNNQVFMVKGEFRQLMKEIFHARIQGI